MTTPPPATPRAAARARSLSFGRRCSPRALGGAAVALSVGLAAACPAPPLDAGRPCDVDGDCPPGLVCAPVAGAADDAAGVCAPADAFDAGDGGGGGDDDDDAGPGDAGPGDAGVAPPASLAVRRRPMLSPRFMTFEGAGDDGATLRIRARVAAGNEIRLEAAGYRHIGHVILATP